MSESRKPEGPDSRIVRKGYVTQKQFIEVTNDKFREMLEAELDIKIPQDFKLVLHQSYIQLTWTTEDEI